MLPLGRHVLELVGINDRVIERQRDLEHRKHGADEEDRGHTADGSGRLPTEPGAEHQAHRRDNEGPFEIAESACMRLRLCHRRASFARTTPDSVKKCGFKTEMRTAEGAHA
ncbi:hypothetical protein D9M70_591520 [compost metagenome]